MPEDPLAPYKKALDSTDEKGFFKAAKDKEEPTDEAKKFVDNIKKDSGFEGYTISDNPGPGSKGYWANKEDYSQTYRSTLQAKKDSIDMSKVGHVNVSHPKYVPLFLLDACKRYGVAEAVLDNISNDESMLAVRNTFPDMDFVNSAREKIVKRQWVQPRQVVDYHRWGGYWSTGDDQDHLIYESCAASQNNRKVIVLYGIKNLKYQQWPILDGISANAAGSNAEVNCTSAKVTRGSLKIIDIPDLSLINDYGLIWFETPFLFKRGDDIQFWLRPKLEAHGKTDNLMLMGITVEALGSHVAG